MKNQAETVRLSILKFDSSFLIQIDDTMLGKRNNFNPSQLSHIIETAHGKILLNELNEKSQQIHDALKESGLQSGPSQKFSSSLNLFGVFLCNRFLSKEILARLNSFPEKTTINLITNMEEIPWELLALKNSCLILKHIVYRTLLSSREPIQRLDKAETNNDKRFVILANPTEDLVGASQEGDMLMELVYEQHRPDSNFALSPHALFGRQVNRKNVSQALRSDISGLDNDSLGVGVVHYAGHAETQGLKLQTSFLHGHELGEVLPELVFLNACQTQSQLDNYDSNENSSFRTHNLIRNIIEAGAQSVIGTFWDVRDGSSLTFSTLFYKKLLEDGLSIGDALFQVRKKLYHSNPDDSIWASFVHYGEPAQTIYSFEIEKKHSATSMAIRLRKRSENAIVSAESIQMVSSYLDILTENIDHLFNCEISRISSLTALIRFGYQRDTHNSYQSREAIAAAEVLAQLAKKLDDDLQIYIGISSGTIKETSFSNKLEENSIIYSDLDDFALDLINQDHSAHKSIVVDQQTFVNNSRIYLFSSAESAGDVLPEKLTYNLEGLVSEPDFRAKLFGRDDDLEDLEDYWRDATKGRRNSAAIIGPPGIGKTRLAHQYIGTLHKDSPSLTIIHLGSQKYVPDRGYSLIGKVIAGLIKIELPVQTENEPKVRRLVYDYVQKLGMREDQINRAVDLFAFTLNLPLQLFPNINPDDLQFELKRYLEWLVTKHTELHPTLIILDNLQWSDLDSLDVLSMLLRSLNVKHLLFLLLFREEFSHPVREQVRNYIELDFIDEQSSRLMLMDLLENKPISKELENFIHPKVNGNPLFLEELIEELISKGQIFFDDQNNQWQITLAQSYHVPTSLKELILSRTGQLDNADQAYAHRAAIVGVQFPIDLYLGDEAKPEQTFRQSSQKLCTIKIMRESTELWSIFEFVNAITRDILYEGLSPDEKEKLHKALAEALMAYEKPMDQLAVVTDENIANHLYLASESSKAWKLCKEVARKARDNKSPWTADGWYSRAIEMIDQEISFALFRGVDDDILPNDLLLSRLELLLENAELMWRSGKFGRSQELLDAASSMSGLADIQQAEIFLQKVKLFDAAGKPLEAITVARKGYDLIENLELNVLQSELLIWNAFMHVRNGNPNEALSLCETGLELINQSKGESSRSQLTYAMGLNCKGYLLNGLGRLGEAAEYLEQAVKVYSTIKDGKGDISGLERCRSNLGWVRFDQGNEEDAEGNLKEARILAEQTGEFTRFVYAINNLGELRREAEDFTGAHEFYTEALSLIENWDMPLPKGVVLMNMGAAYLGLNQLNQAETHLLQALPLLISAGGKQYFSEIFSYIIRLYQAKNEPEEVKQYAQKAIIELSELVDVDRLMTFQKLLEDPLLPF